MRVATRRVTTLALRAIASGACVASPRCYGSSIRREALRNMRGTRMLTTNWLDRRRLPAWGLGFGLLGSLLGLAPVWAQTPAPASSAPPASSAAPAGSSGAPGATPPPYMYQEE